MRPHPVQATVKERYKALNTAITAIHESQSGWTVPDATLRANLKVRCLAATLSACLCAANLGLL